MHQVNVSAGVIGQFDSTPDSEYTSFDIEEQQVFLVGPEREMNFAAYSRAVARGAHCF